ncbi:MAG: CBS domain-containing protein [Thermodesulfobacteriota bacterium]
MQTAKEIMTTTVVTVGPEMPVEQLAALLRDRRISGAPVVDGTGALVGVVTESDLIDQAKKIHIPTAISILDSVIFLESAKGMEREITKMTGVTVADICTKNPLTITEATPLDEIATIMAERRVHTLPVLRGMQLIGVVGKSDVIKTLAR